MSEIKLSELSTILKKSEVHASKCTIDHGTSYGIYRIQTQKGYLTLSVSSKMLKQAIKIFELFLKRMFKEGFTLFWTMMTIVHALHRQSSLTVK